MVSRKAVELLTEPVVRVEWFGKLAVYHVVRPAGLVR